MGIPPTLSVLAKSIIDERLPCSGNDVWDRIVKLCAAREHSMGMAPTTKKLLEQVESWPIEDQEELVQYAREIEARRTGVYRLSDEEREAIDRSLEDVRQGRFASEERIAEIFKKARR